MKSPPIWLVLIMSIFSSNVLTMCILNSFTLDSAAVAPVYFICLLILVVLSYQYKLSVSPGLFSPLVTTLIVCVFSVIFLIPHLTPFAEIYFGGVVGAMTPDEHWHIQEISSLVNTPRFPAISTFAPGKYLSFYYAPWMLPAAIYKLAPLSMVTIKLALAIAYMIYTTLFFFTLVSFASWYFVSRAKAFLFLFLFVLNSGLVEGTKFFQEPFVHHGWWMNNIFGMMIQLTDFSVSAT